MILQDKLPDGVEVDGKFYKMDFDFRNVLRMIDILDRDDLMPEAQAYNALRCVCKRPRNVYKVLKAVKGLLFTNGKKKSGPRITDFKQDSGLIRAAFLQAYKIDLYHDRVHWIEFTELLNGIPDDTRYSWVVGIRARPLPKPTKWNLEEREWLLKAKADVAIKMTEKEREKQYEQDVADIASALMAWAGGSDGNG